MIGVCVAWLLAPAVVAPPRMIATPREIANAAFAARRVCLRIIEILRSVVCPGLGRTLPTRLHPTRVAHAHHVVGVAPAQRTRRDEALDQRDGAVAGEGEHRD